MTPWFIATEPFTPRDGDLWRKYIEWSGLIQLKGLLTLDQGLCPPVLTKIKDEYWPHIVKEDFMLHYFLDLEFLRREIENAPEKNLLCVVRNPPVESVEAPVKGFEFVGYDLVDVECSVSALTNCGGFPEAFANSELSRFGLLTEFRRALEVQRLLRSCFPGDPHANCLVWAIFRSTE